MVLCLMLSLRLDLTFRPFPKFHEYLTNLTVPDYGLRHLVFSATRKVQPELDLDLSLDSQIN